MSRTSHIISSFFVNLCRLFVSAVFIISGGIKLIDPHGTEYKIQDYLIALHIDGLFNVGYIPLLLALLLAMTELFFGVALLFGIRRRTTLSVLLLLLLIYTPLTLWLAVTDAVADCGCFGDVWHLTNWQTFFKNVVMAAMSVLLWFQQRRMFRLIPASAQWLVNVTTFCAGVAVASYSLYYEPVIDFRPFHVGQDISAAMQWPEDVRQQPEIIDFYLEPLPFDGAASHPIPDVEELLADSSYTFLLTMPQLETAADDNMDRINDLYDDAALHGFRFLALTPSGEESLVRWRDLTGAEYDFAFMDGLTLKTIARSNPALVLLHKGVIIGKWGHRQLPSKEQIAALVAASS